MAKRIKIALLSKLCLAFLILTFTLPAWAQSTYYVKSGGDDNAAGTSDETAWAHCPGLSGWTGSATLSNGDTVYFRSQDTWTSSNDSVLDIDTAGVTYDGSTWGSGTRATLQITAGGALNGVVKINASNTSFSSFDIDMNNQNTCGIGVGTYATSDVSNITIDDCKVHDSYIPSGQFDYGIHIGGYAAANVDVTNVTVTNTEVYNTGHEAFAIYPTWTKSGCTAQNITIRNCSAHNAGINGTWWGDGYLIVNNADNVTIEDSVAYDNDIGLRVTTSATYQGSPNDLIVRRCELYENHEAGISLGTLSQIDADGIFYNNFIYNNGTMVGAHCYDLVIGGANNWNNTVYSFYNNTIYNTEGLAGSGYQHSVHIQEWGTMTGTPTFNFRNNIVYTADFRPVRDRYDRLTYSNNLIFRTSGSADEHVYNGTSYNRSGVTTWEATAQNTDPLFADVSADNYRITDGSDVIDNGADLSAYFTMDYYGNSRPDEPGFDIGAHEYQDAVTTSPSVPVNLQVVAP